MSAPQIIQGLNFLPSNENRSELIIAYVAYGYVQLILDSSGQEQSRGTPYLYMHVQNNFVQIDYSC